MSWVVTQSRSRWAPVAFALLAVAACGGRATRISPASSCTDQGAVHANGDTWTCSDGCNICVCNNGEISSSLIACRPSGAEGGAPGAEAGGAGATAPAQAGADRNDLPPANTEGGAAGSGGTDASPEPTPDAAAPQPDCAPGGPGLSDCGVSRESCCTSLEVTGGMFYRNYTNDGGGPTAEARPATISSFRLDKYDVTVGRFRQFISAWNGGAGWLPPVGSGKHTHLNGGKGLVDVGRLDNSPGVSYPDVVYETGWAADSSGDIAPTDRICGARTLSLTTATWTPSVGSNENLPINCVNWQSAYAFCIWDGGFLPSDAELAFAAAGGAQELSFPWGAAPPGTNNRYAIYGCYYPDMSGNCTGLANVAPVGTASLGVGLWGQLDLAGNVGAWVMDWIGHTIDVPCENCATLALTSEDPMWRGSAADAQPDRLHGYSSNFAFSGGTPDIGFRCARTP